MAHSIAARWGLAIFVGTGLPIVPARALDRATLQRFFTAPYAVGERDGDLPIWPIFKQTSSRDELVAHVFEYTDFAPAPNAPGEPVHRLVAIRPSGAFLEVLVVGLEKPGLLNWLGRRPTFNFVRQDPVVAKPAPEAAQGVVALSRDFVRDRLGLAVDDRAHHSAEFVK